MDITLQALCYLAIQMYVSSEVYASLLYKTRVLQKLYEYLEGNMEKSEHLWKKCLIH